MDITLGTYDIIFKNEKDQGFPNSDRQFYVV